MVFIKLFNTKSEALSVRHSPNTSIYNHRGIQLLPLKKEKYIQSTNVISGIELEDWEVFLVDLCTGKKTDVSTNFMIERVFSDNNGNGQIEWSLKELPEMGYGLVYLEVNQLMFPSGYADTWYSNVFQVTNINQSKTARIDYRDDINENMMSVQLQIYFWHNSSLGTLSTYTEAYTGESITSMATFSRYEVWDTQNISRNLLLDFYELFKLTYVYIDLIRCSPFKPFEIPNPIASENFTKFTFQLGFRTNDIYDPNFVPEHVDTTPRIDFTDIQYLGNNNVMVYYSVYNFEPANLVVESSINGISWAQTTLLNQGSGQEIHPLQFPMGSQIQLRITAHLEQVTSNTLNFEVEVPDTISQVVASYNAYLNRWRITVIYVQSYYNGSNVRLITQRPGGNPIETSEVNDGSVSNNILAMPGELIKVYLKSTDNSFESEIKTITLTL